MKSRKFGFFGKRRDDRRGSKPQDKSVLRKSLVESLEKRELLAADWNPGLVANTGFFTDAAARQAVIQYVSSQGGKVGGGQTGGGSALPEGGANDIIAVAEVEPNNTQLTAQLVPLAGNLGVNITGTNGSISNVFDVDWYSFDLQAGDILDARLISGGSTHIATFPWYRFTMPDAANL